MLIYKTEVIIIVNSLGCSTDKIIYTKRFRTVYLVRSQRMVAVIIYMPNIYFRMSFYHHDTKHSSGCLLSYMFYNLFHHGIITEAFMQCDNLIYQNKLQQGQLETMSSSNVSFVCCSNLHPLHCCQKKWYAPPPTSREQKSTQIFIFIAIISISYNDHTHYGV